MARGLPVVVIFNASAWPPPQRSSPEYRRTIGGPSSSASNPLVRARSDHYPLNSDVAMRLTTARYYTPSGRPFSRPGSRRISISPSQLETVDTGRVRREADLRGALSTATDNGDAADENDTTEDYQLARALDLLRGIHLFESRIAN